ncbi:MAG: F0F1 ATP synthase subunit B' [Hyphomicrobiaceae bacterium]
MPPALFLAAAAEKKSALPQLDPSSYAGQLFWLAITFGILYYLLSRHILPRIARAVEGRMERIERDLAEAERLKADTDRAIADYEAKLAAARVNASEIARQTRERLATGTNAERDAIEAQIAARLGEAEARINSGRQQALGEVDSIAQDAAVEIVRKLVGVEPSQADIAAAIARYRTGA